MKDVDIRKVSKKDLSDFKFFVKACSAQSSIPCLYIKEIEERGGNRKKERKHSATFVS